MAAEWKSEKKIEFSREHVRFVNEKCKKQETFYLYNRAGISKKLRVAVTNHSDKVFHVLSGTDEYVLAAGLRLPVVIQYSPGDEEGIRHQGELEVYADDKMVLTVPMIGEPCGPHFIISASVVDLGHQVMNHQIVSSSFTITNTGSGPGRYNISFLSPLPSHLSVTPLEGKILPQKLENINIKFLCQEVGMLQHKLQVLTDGTQLPFEVTITGDVVQQRFVLKDLNTSSSSSVVHLGATYYGSVATKRMVLYNDSPATTNYVANINMQCPGTEQGADISSTIAMACTQGGVHQNSWREQGGVPPISSIIKVTPDEGSLGPYESRVVDFSFTPTIITAATGWKHHQGEYCRRDYAVFLYFVPAGVNEISDNGLEIAVAASAHPVNLSYTPQEGLQFGSAEVNQSCSKQLTLTNKSDCLSISFNCHVPAHFKLSSPRGKIPPGKSILLEVIFLPHQLGCLDGKLVLDVLGIGKENESVVVDTVIIPLRGEGERRYAGKERRRKSAQVDDLAASIRPHDRRVEIRTHFTNVQRHSYIDPDYAYTDEEQAAVRRHRIQYLQYLRTRRELRMQRDLQRRLGSSKQLKPADNGIRPAEGLTSPKLPLIAIEPPAKEHNTDVMNQLVTHTQMALVEDLPVKPTTLDQVEMCSATLTSKQLCSIIIKPSKVNFGDVVLNIDHKQQLQVMNGLDQNVMITFKAECCSLNLFTTRGNTRRSTDTLVLPPSSCTMVNVSVNRNIIGPYHQSIQFFVNKSNPQYIPVSANGVQMSLELSASTIVLNHPQLASPTSGMQGSVCLYNRFSVPATFKWEMEEEVEQTLFITHPEGVVPPKSFLHCEFAVQGTYHCTSQLPLVLLVNGANEQKVDCLVQYGKPQCVVEQNNVLFGSVPLNLTTSRRVVIKNTGKCHAYFNVPNIQSVIPYLTIAPGTGCIPVGGNAELTLSYHPTSVTMIDRSIRIRLREGGMLKLRIAAKVEPPKVMIDKNEFNFGCVQCGVEAALPFALINNGVTRAQVTFDLSNLKDFAVTVPQHLQEEEKEPLPLLLLPSTSQPLPTSTVQTVTILKSSSVQCTITFAPKEVAAYDYILPVLVNNMKAAFPPPAHWPPSHTPAQVSVGASLPLLEDTPCRRVLATALRPSYKPPLLSSASHTEQVLSPAGTPSGCISSNPLCISVHPVPLCVTVEAQFVIIVDDHPNNVKLVATVPDGYTHDPMLTVMVMEHSLAACSHEDGRVEVPCILTFSSSLPTSITDYITFTNTRTGKSKQVPFSVVADNSVFSVFEFLSNHLNSCAIKTNQNGIPFLTFSFSSASFSTTSSAISHINLSSVSLEDHSFVSTISSSADYSDMFLQDCMSVLCRYFAVCGWSCGFRHFSTPTDLIDHVGQDQTERPYGRPLGSSRGKLMDMIKHLTSKLPLGVSSVPPACFTATEKVHQHHFELTAALSLLRKEGAVLGMLSAELLMHYRDYTLWKQLNSITPTSSASFPVSVDMSEEEFNQISLRSWTTLLGQMVKVFVLPRVLSHAPSHIIRQVIEREEEETEVDEVVRSNVYSRPELVLLEWLNYHYTRQYRKVFGKLAAVSRQVSTFDIDLMDCTVFACAVAAHVPSLVNTHLCRMYAEPSTPEQCTHNALLLVSALRSIGINFDIQSSDLSAPNPLCLILLSSHLFLALPHYIPSHTVMVEAPLHTPTIQTISVDNPSSKSLTYTVMLKGQDAASFVVHDEMIKLPGSKSAKLVVQFTGRHTKTHEALLLLVGELGVGVRGETISFAVKGDISGTLPLVNTSVTAPLFSTVEFSISFFSPFYDDGEFTVHLCEGKPLQSLLPGNSPRQRTKGKKRRSKQVVAMVPLAALQQRSDSSMHMFHCSQQTLVVSGSGKTNLIKLQVTSLRFTSRQCHVLLSNPQLGDIVVTATVSVSLPSPSLPVSNRIHRSSIMDENSCALYMKVMTGERVKEEIIIESNNPLFDQAALALSKWTMSSEKMRRRELTHTLKYASLRTAMEALELGSSPKSHQQPVGADQVHYKVKSSCELFHVPEMISVHGGEGQRSVLPVEFLSEEEGHFPCKIVLSSQHDVRVYNVEVTVLGRGRCAVLEMRTPALQPLTQQIPLVNPSTLDWLLKADITGVGYSGSGTITVNALSTNYYHLTFCPRWEGSMEGHLTLTNVSDGSQHFFNLKGVAERPLAVDVVKIHTQAKKRTTQILRLPNSSDRTTIFRVETDLQFVSGPSSVSVSGGDVVDYPVMVEPLERGQYHGAVVFVAEAKSGRVRNCGVSEHLWFSLEVTVDPAPSENSYTIQGHVFSSSISELLIDNPYAYPLELQVTVDGEGVSGPAQVRVEPHSHLQYPLTYNPRCIGNTIGSFLIFGRPDGEVAYRLELEALDPQPVVVQLMSSELGMSTHLSLLLNNPLDSDVTVTCSCSNGHFTLPGVKNDGKLLLSANSSVEAKIVFTPSQLTNRENGRLLFTSEEFGEQLFLLEGEGKTPSLMERTIIKAPLSGNAVANLTFTNHLQYSSHFTVTLANNDADLYCLLLKRSRHIFLNHGVSLDIPILFAPDNMVTSETTVVVKAENVEDLKWNFPVKGEPQIVMLARRDMPQVTSLARERVEEQVVVRLTPGVVHDAVTVRPVTPGNEEDSAAVVRRGDINAERLWEKYKYCLVCESKGKEHQKLFDCSTGVKLAREDVEDNCTTLTFLVTFMPLKPFCSLAHLHIQPAGHGSWQIPILFKAKGAVPDDFITLEAHSISRVTTIGIRLTSTRNSAADFTAHFDAGSAPELWVEPSSGVLPPCNERGTLLTLFYKPCSFSKSCTGTLIVETAEDQWCYAVSGHPVNSSSSTVIQSREKHTSPALLVTAKNTIQNSLQLANR